ncbi:hypothetical protein BJX70DRAFT_32261 [Aspergillus crustosus]
MLEALPDLELAGRKVLDFLVPRAATPKSVVDKAKVLSEPGNTQSRRLQHTASGLHHQTKAFGDQTYIDADFTTRLISTTLASRRVDVKDWSPSPIVQLANCARFAQDLLLAGSRGTLQRHAIRNVQDLFPLPFTSGIVTAGQAKAPGESALESETFALALEIRTQSLILHLEEHQDDPDFSPKEAVTRYFLTRESSRTSSLRGFNLPQFGGADGMLPEQFRKIVQDRLNGILLEEEEDGSIDVEALKGAYRWRQFIMRAAEWFQKRAWEIKSELEKRTSVQAIQNAFFASNPSSFVSTQGHIEPEPNGGIETSEQIAKEQEFTLQVITPQEATEADSIEPNGIEPEDTGPEGVEQEPAPLTDIQQEQPETTSVHNEKERRRSSKSKYLNSSSLQSLARRKERLQSGIESSNRDREPNISYTLPHASVDQNVVSRRQPSPALSTISPAPEDAPALLHDEPDITIGDDLHLAVGTDGSLIERSHSPPVPRSTVPWSRRDTGISRITEDTDEMVTARSLWDRTKDVTSWRSAVISNSRPSFIDRQSNAERVSDIDSPGAVARVEDRASGKRARPEDDADSDVDRQYFDYDNRSVDIAHQRAKKPGRSSHKRQRVELLQTREETIVVADDNNADESLPTASRVVPGRRHPGSISPQPPAQKSAYTGRQPWTVAEDRRLLRLMEMYHNKWSNIEGGNITQRVHPGEERFRGRNQVALKDRARNLKIKHHRERLPIPECLVNVTMKEKDYQNLERYGISVPRPEGTRR